jgi:hypothetical protein
MGNLFTHDSQGPRILDARAWARRVTLAIGVGGGMLVFPTAALANQCDDEWFALRLAYFNAPSPPQFAPTGRRHRLRTFLRLPQPRACVRIPSKRSATVATPPPVLSTVHVTAEDAPS